METSQLVDRAKAGDGDAFVRLVERYQRVAITRAWSIVGDFHTAQDVAQEGFVHAFQKLESLKKSSSFGPWLLEIVRREAIRKNRRTQRLVPIDFADCEARIGVLEYDWQQQHAQVIEAIAKLPDHEQDVVVLHYLDGNSTKQVAEILDRPQGTVTKQLSRAIERLRNSLSEIPNEII